MHLEELLSCSQSHNLRYAKEVLNLALEQGDFPPDAYRLAAERLRVTYPGPKTTLKKLAAALSDGKIIT